MNIEKIVLDISHSKNEKNFNLYIANIAKENIQNQKNICQRIFKLFDIEAEKENPNQPYLRTLIAVPIELCVFHQNQQKNKSDYMQTNELSEFISSHLLARSNGSHESLRLAMLVFFAHIENQPIWKKQKILERFGENILHSIFRIYSTKKNKSLIAFSFLAENLECFLSTSPELASMTSSFLQTYMLRHQVDFINFIIQYKNYLSHKPKSAQFFIVHLSFLIRQAFELEQTELVTNLLKIFMDYVYSFENANPEHDLGIFVQIALQSKNLKARDTGLYIKNELQMKHEISWKLLFKHLSLQSNESTMTSPLLKNSNKKHVDGVSVFQKIILLCTDIT